MAHGWAVQEDENGKIDMRTVSDTRRAAIVNYLVVEKGIAIYAWSTDEAIEAVWWQCRDGAEVIQVTVQRQQ